MKLRLGRHNKQLVYVQNGTEPSNDDPLMAVCMNPDLAALVVETFNAQRAPEPAAVTE